MTSLAGPGPSPEWRAGLAVGPFSLLGPVARGGMGEIWLARQASTDNFSRTVIVKRLLQDTEDLEGQSEMLLDEARIASQLNHPNIVQLLELGRDAGSLFIVMEYLLGENLSVVMRTAAKRNLTIPVPIATGIALQVARALAYAHAKVDRAGQPLQLVHRDVTPQNVIVTYEGVAKLIDFGIAKATGRSTMTTEGLVKGKLAYMSPEQARSESLDGRTDVFSLGVTMFEMLSGTRFHSAPDELSLFRLLAERGPFPRLAERAPHLPAALSAIVDSATAPALHDRPEARVLATSLEELLSAESGGNPPAISEWVSHLFADRIEQRATQLASALRPRATSTVIAPPSIDDEGSSVDSGEWFSHVPALDHDGRIVAPVAHDVTPELPEGPADAEPLELTARALSPPVAIEEPPLEESPAQRPRRSRALPIAMVVLAGLVAVVAISWRRLPSFGLDAGPRALVINSNPSGATVHIGGSAVGRTPFAADNHWRGTTSFEVTMPSYAAYSGTFEGGTEVVVSAKLHRR